MPILRVFFLVALLPLSLYGQSLPLLEQAAPTEVGVPRYIQLFEARYRLLFGFGGNAGVGALTPRSFIGLAEYQTSSSVLGAGFISSSSTGFGFPRRSYSEFDALYSIAYDDLLTHYELPSQHFHASFGAGLSLAAYSTVWHRFRRGAIVPDSSLVLLQPNTTEIALGLPIQAQAIYEPFRYAGIGAIAFANFSKLQPSFGGAIILETRY